MNRVLDRLLALLLAVFASLLMVLLAGDALPPSGYAPGVDLDAMSTQEFLKYASIDLNRASQEELIEIYGIGEALSKSIIEYRETTGPYASVEDLLKVRGIGEKRLAMMRKYVYAG